ncbi:MAG TPA: hypothetical protein VGO50_16820 [Pyrinomonadaceae bacterium]|nr:hypothetical protein [Pyrinomonadaceae bacterium]
MIIFGLTTTATLTVTFSGNADFIKWGISILLAGALSVQFYSLSVLQAEEWGTYIKAMFDLYRNDLLVKLGISQKPYSKKAERELWKAISAQFVYGDHLGTPRFDYHQYFPAERPYLPEKDLQKQLSVSRYFKLLKENLYEIYLVIEAAPLDPSASPKTLAENFWIVDVLPENWLFSYSSANFVKNQPNLAFYHAYTPIETEISGRECKFKIPAISPGENLRISYQAFVLKK